MHPNIYYRTFHLWVSHSFAYFLHMLVSLDQKNRYGNMEGLGDGTWI